MADTKYNQSGYIQGIRLSLFVFWSIQNITQEYNEKFVYKKTSDIDNLINTVKTNNIEVSNKVCIVYNNKNYKTIDELNQLMNDIDTMEFYNVEFCKLFSEVPSPISKIYISPYVNPSLHADLFTIESYQGEHVNGADVRVLFAYIINITKENTDLEVVLNYSSNDNKNIVLKSENGTLDISEIQDQIKTSYTYNVEINFEVTDEKILYINITTN